MKNLLFSQPIVAAGNTFYIPVPCRGNIKSVRVAGDVAMVATETLTLGRGTDVVNTLTVPTGGIAAGGILDGVPDTTKKGLIFDPDDSTAANKVIKCVASAGFVATGTLNMILSIEYDDYAYVEQKPKEAV